MSTSAEYTSLALEMLENSLLFVHGVLWESRDGMIDVLRMQKVLKKPGPQHRNGSFWKAPLGSPRILRQHSQLLERTLLVNVAWS